MIKLNLNENFICRIWEESSYYSDLKETTGQKVEIINYGHKNSDAGPDYYNAKIRIGEIIYTGCIEIHKSESGWHEHKHKKDNKYNEVILQVVFYKEDFSNDSKIPVAKKSRNIPTVILSEFLTKSVHDIWKEIIDNPSESFRLPCFPKNNEVAVTIKNEWLNKLSQQRLIQKAEKIIVSLDKITDDNLKKIFWEKILFEYICEALGYSKNKVQFLKLSEKIDFKKLINLKLTKIQIDSVLFGLSGFLKDLRYKDKYIEDLKFNWNILQDKIRKDIMDKSEWNFFRLRPPNFPSIRIAYASGLLYEILNNNFLKSIVNIFEESGNVYKSLTELFKNIEVSDYWKRHYNFGKESKSETTRIGNERIKDITTNVLLPLMYMYSEKFVMVSLKNRVEYIYKNEKQKSGGNEITRVMEKQLDVKVNSLSDEQALIQLHNFYCMKGNCSSCNIGKIVFENISVHEPLKIILY